MPFTPPDIIICLILGFFTFNGFRHGFIEEMARIISLVGGFILASKFHNLLIPYLQRIETETIRVTVAYFGIFVLSVIVITIVAKILQKFIELVLLGWLNRLLGVLLGLLKGFLIISLIIFIIQALPFNKFDADNTIRQKLEKESVMYQICNHVKELVILTMPMDNKLDMFQKKINEISNEENVQKLLKQR
tara:strand:- start:14 stop:586 length:573 start_codon:yes stop_codon:yes gene_type:complete